MNTDAAINLNVGMSNLRTHVVSETDLATNWQNDVEVLSTPILLWLAEITCMSAIEEAMSPPWMTVGAAHTMEHLAPTPEGFVISITATLVEIDRRKLVFEVTAHDGVETILSGKHERFLVNGDKFRVRVKTKSDERTSSPALSQAAAKGI
jgi:fluoroacetyl-CoA thioesterase